MLYKKFFHMDVSNQLKLHPRAENFLFEEYITLRKIFSDVLGHLETDYISIALINSKGYRAILSFGFKRINPFIQNKNASYCAKLLGIGKYCLREIGDIIPSTNDTKQFISRPTLKLIINNQVNYEISS